MTNEPSSNWAWRAMEAADRAALQPSLTLCHLPQGDVLMRAGDAVDAVYFPVTAEVANIVRLSDGKGCLAATVSCNGVTGLAAFLADELLGWDLDVQIGGDAWRLPSDVLRKRCDVSSELRKLLLSLTHQIQIQSSVNATCHSRHALTPRVARWLLTTQERTGTKEIPVTQDLVADWMGVSRTSVVESFRTLAELGATETRRARVTIVDRAKLKSQACECYGRINQWQPVA